VVYTQEQDRRRIETVEALWSVALPTELQQQWSRFPMSHPVVVAEVNRRASGNPGMDAYVHLSQFLEKTGQSLPLTRVASVCCGAGALERGLMSIGLITSCTGYDLASGALNIARQDAAAAGYHTLRYEHRDLEKNGLDMRNLQLVFAHQGVHHIERLEETFDAIRESLEIGGYFHLHEFVGPDRFQWADRQLEEMTRWVQSLPERYRRTRDGLLRDSVGRATIEEMIASDPSEAVRSSAIEPLLAERFEIVERRELGMTLVMSALADIAHNFAPDDTEAVAHVQRLLDREMELIETGELTSDFVTILAQRVS
jgi:SAM-dependent methyltransferase